MYSPVQHKETIVYCHRCFPQKLVFFGCKKRNRQQKKKEAKKRTDEKELMFRMNLY